MKTPSTRAQSPASDRLFVTALARGLEILHCFDAKHVELGSAEIATLTGLPQPTVWRLCSTLLKCGYLIQSVRNDKFRIGLRSLSLGASAAQALSWRHLVNQEMQQIAQLSNCAVSLAIPDGNDMLIVARAIPESPLLIVNLTVGSKLPMGVTAMGWAYLAALDEGAREAAFKRLRLSRNDVMRKHVDKAIAAYDKTGYIANNAIWHAEVNALAVPIVVPGQDQILAINCGAPATVAPLRELEKNIAPRLKALARSIGLTISASALTDLTQA